MLNLLDELTPLDNKRIENYIHLFGAEEGGYIGNERWLADWAKNNKHLFRVLGGKLIHKVPFEMIKPKEELEGSLGHLICNSPFIIHFRDKISEDEREEVQFYRYEIKEIVTVRTLNNDKIMHSIKIKVPIARNTLSIQIGMKPVRALQKIIKYLGYDDLKDEFEDFRIKHSLIFNEKKIYGNMCFSIHPLDFLTMSDNAEGWSSCMNWSRGGGCYHLGTVEMMNSNNVIVCYLESSSQDFPFGYHSFKEEANPFAKEGEEWSWNSKKWRCLFYVTNDIIMNGKAYPYRNDNIALFCLNEIKHLSEQNCNRHYEFGPEPYKDMKHIGSLNRMEITRSNIFFNNTFKHNIIFDTNAMYNDMFNDHNGSSENMYLCYRNKVKKTKLISLSGKAPCLCCGETTFYRKDEDDYYDDEDYYNDRFENRENCICEECQEERRCSICRGVGIYDTFYIDGEQICHKCLVDNTFKCPCCGKLMFIKETLQDFIFLRMKDSPIFLQDLQNFYYSGIPRVKTLERFKREYENNKIIPTKFCDDCVAKKIKSGEILVAEKVDEDPVRRYNSWIDSMDIKMTNKIYTLEEAFPLIRSQLEKPALDILEKEFYDCRKDKIEKE